MMVYYEMYNQLNLIIISMGISWGYISDILVIYWGYLGYVLGISWGGVHDSQGLCA